MYIKEIFLLIKVFLWGQTYMWCLDVWKNNGWKFFSKEKRTKPKKFIYTQLIYVYDYVVCTDKSNQETCGL